PQQIRVELGILGSRRCLLTLPLRGRLFGQLTLQRVKLSVTLKDIPKRGNHYLSVGLFRQLCTIILIWPRVATMKLCFCLFLKYSVSSYYTVIGILQKERHSLSSIAPFM